MKPTIILFATVLASTAAVGCSKETTSSANVRTEGVAALIDVTSEDGKNSTVHVDMRVGGSSSNTFLILENGDKLTASATAPAATGTEPKPETKDMRAESEGEYEAEFATAAEDTEFKVEFLRDVDADALANSGKMPAPFEISSLPEDQPSRAMNDITVTWGPTDKDATMEMELTGSCIFSQTIEVPGDSGSHVIKAGTIDSTGGEMPSECDVTVTITRTQVGTADPVFDKESWFKLHQVRAAKFTSKP